MPMPVDKNEIDTLASAFKLALDSKTKREMKREKKGVGTFFVSVMDG